MKAKITRRTFLKESAKKLTILGLVKPGISFLTPGKAKEYDVLISGGLVFDGSGNPGVQTDIALKRNLIRAMGSHFNPHTARRVIDARGMAVSPGFIDAHSHTEVELLANPRAESQLRQGVTTEISGNCGDTPFPISDSIFSEKEKYYREEYDVTLDWRDINGFFRRLEKQGISLNYATLMGHGSLRGDVVGYNDRPPTKDELEKMKKLVESNLKSGALGISSGLVYPPGSYAKTDELIELCRIAARNHGVYATHIRDEGDRILESLKEAIEISRKSGASLQISHLKIAFPRNWSKIETVITEIDAAWKEGIRIMADRYPYIAGANNLSSMFPLWIQQGTTAEFISRLKSKTQDHLLRAHLKAEEKKIGSWKNILISDVSTEENKRFEGMNVLEASRLIGKSPFDFIRDLIIEEEDRVGRILFYGTEENLRRILMHPLVMIGADGSAVAPYGILNKGMPHPRLYGTFARILGHYAREEKIFTLAEAIRKMTTLTARKFGISRRGEIKENYFADLVIFNPDKVKDASTWKNPKQYPKGIELVLVNGQIVIEKDHHTGNCPGMILKKICSVNGYRN